MWTVELPDEGATRGLAEALASAVRAGDVIGLEGSLGAGKTTFVQRAVHALGVPEETPVTSPTFALVSEYEGRLPIVHADLYRLESEIELEELGLDELREDGAVLFVEWGRKFPAMADRTALWIELEIVSDDARRAEVVPCGARGDEIIGEIRTRRFG